MKKISVLIIICLLLVVLSNDYGLNSPTAAFAEETTEQKKNINKIVVKSATKKKSAKKVYIFIKEVYGSKSYEIQFSANKKFNKILVRKRVKSNSSVISSKKLKSVKKLYVRARVHMIYKGITFKSKWSRVKKVKIK